MLKISEQSKEKYKNNVVPGEIYLVVDTVALYFSEHTFFTDSTYFQEADLDGLAKTYDSSYWLTDSLSISESLCSKDSIDYSAVESNVLEVELASESGNIKQLVGKKVTCKQIVGGETVPLGVYTIAETTLDGDYYTKVKAYDGMKKFIDTRIDSWWNNQVSFPISLRSLLIELCKYVGIAYSLPDSWCNSDLAIIQNIVLNEDARASELLGMIQQVSGAFFHTNRDGILTIVKHDAELTSVPYQNLMDDLSIGDFKTPSIDNVQIRNSNDDIGVSANGEKNAYIVQENYLLGSFSEEELKSIAVNILESIKNDGYRPFSAKFKSLPYVELGDPIKVTSYNGNSAAFWITNRKLSGDYLLTDEIDIKGSIETINSVKSNSKKVVILNRKIHEVVNTIDELRSTIGGISTKYNGVITAIDYFYLYNSGETPKADDPRWTRTPSAALPGQSVWEKKVFHYIDKEPVTVITNRTVNNLVGVIPYYRLSTSKDSITDDATYFGTETFFSDKDPYTYFYDAFPWDEKIPDNVPGYYRWIRFKYLYSDGSYSWSEPQCDKTFDDVYKEIVDAKTEIKQTKEQIELKADESKLKEYQNSLTKQIEQEVTDRKAAITESSNQIMNEVSRVTSSKAQSFKIYRVSVREGEVPTKSLTDYGWTTENVAWKNGYHIWMMTATVYSDDDIIYSEPTDISGANGANGQNGKDGQDGQDGANGKGIKSELIEWKLSESQETWQSKVYTIWSKQQPSWVQDTYLWSRRTITYDDSSTNVIYTCEVSFKELYDLNKETSSNLKILDNTVSAQAKTITTLTGSFDEYKKTTDASIKANSDGIGSIELKVSSKVEKKDLEDKLSAYATTSEMNSAISQSAKEISLTVSEKVGYDEVIAAINLSSESATIKASKINFDFGTEREKITLKGDTKGVLFEGNGWFEVEATGGFYIRNNINSKSDIQNDIYTLLTTSSNNLCLRNFSYDRKYFANYISLSSKTDKSDELRICNYCYGDNNVNDYNLISMGIKPEDSNKHYVEIGNSVDRYYLNALKFSTNDTSREAFLFNSKLTDNKLIANQIYFKAESERVLMNLYQTNLNSNTYSNYLTMYSYPGYNQLILRNNDSSGNLAGQIEFRSDKSATSASTLMIRGGNGKEDMWIGLSQDLIVLKYSNYTDRFELNSSESIVWHGANGIKVTNNNGIELYVGNAKRLYIDSSGKVSSFNGLNSGYTIVSTAIGGGDGMHPIAFGWSGSSLSCFVDNTNVWSTSDERLKKDIINLEDDYISAIGEVDIKQFRFKVAPYNTNTLHFGVVAQDLRSSLVNHGLSLKDIAVTGTFRNGDDATEYYSVDKEEFLMARMAYNERRIKQLEERIKELS